MTTAQDQETAVPVSFRLTTFLKRKRNEPGITRVDSQRVCLGAALDWVLAQVPEDAIEITYDHDGDSDAVTVRIDWAKIPYPVRYGPPGTRR